MMSTTYAFLLTSLAGLSTMLGTIFILLPIRKKDDIIVKALSFAAGVMIMVSFTDLLPEAYHLLHTTFLVVPTLLFVGIFLCLGVLLSMLIDRYIPEESSQARSRVPSLYRVGIISMLAIILHNIPEGIATFITANEDMTLGITLAIAIALHNIPEGISISIPLYYATGSRGKALFYTFLSGASELLGAVLAFLFLEPFINHTIMGLLYAVIAGIMIHISFYELLPSSLKYKKFGQTIGYFVLGMVFMYISSCLLC